MLRRSLLPLIAGVVTACDVGCTSDCVMGPCGTAGGDVATPVIVGFPSARAFSGIGRLTAGDSVTLYAIRVRKSEEPCAGADTLRSTVQWGVSNPAVASLTPLSDGGVRVRVLAQGTFDMLMRDGGSGALSTTLDAKFVYTCPANLTIVNIAVAP
jgi:hypothetical protein